jgi:hypothetical protein
MRDSFAQYLLAVLLELSPNLRLFASHQALDYFGCLIIYLEKEPYTDCELSITRISAYDRKNWEIHTSHD